MKIHEFHYSSTNTYLIEGADGLLLFDTGWAGTFPLFCAAMGEAGIPVQRISDVLISHFHPDHMGIAQEIADQGAVILVPDVQQAYVHAADSIFAKEKKTPFSPIKDGRLRIFPLEDSRAVLKEIGVDGELFHTPGHSDDSISLFLDDGQLFVGDLNPLYELELYRGTQTGESWEKLLALKPKIVYYGHAKKAVLSEHTADAPSNGQVSTAGTGALQQETIKGKKVPGSSTDEKLFALVSRIMKLVDKGADSRRIQKKTGADAGFIDDVMRMYLTHQNIGVQGILDRIEIKNR